MSRGRYQNRRAIAQGCGRCWGNSNPARSAVQREPPHALSRDGRVAGDGDIRQSGFGIAAAVGALVVCRVAVTAAKQTQESSARAGQVFRHRDADGRTIVRRRLVVHRAYRDGGGARIGVVYGSRSLRRVRRHIATVVHGGSQQVAAVVIGRRGVLERMKRQVDRGAGALHMNAGRAVGSAVNQRETRHAAESQRTVAHRHIGLHHVVNDVRVGDRIGADRVGAAVLGHSQRGWRSHHRRVVGARDRERRAGRGGQVAAADVAFVVDCGGKGFDAREVGVALVTEVVGERHQGVDVGNLACNYNARRTVAARNVRRSGARR